MAKLPDDRLPAVQQALTDLAALAKGLKGVERGKVTDVSAALSLVMSLGGYGGKVPYFQMPEIHEIFAKNGIEDLVHPKWDPETLRKKNQARRFS